VTALAVRQIVAAANLTEFGNSAFTALSDALSATGAEATNPFGALFPGDFFEIERSEITVFAPVGPGHPRPPAGGGVRLVTIPAVEAAVAVHEGAFDEIDRTYGALGTVVAERAIGVDGPIREYYLVSSFDTDDAREHRTEVCWPVFLTGVKDAQ